MMGLANIAGLLAQVDRNSILKGLQSGFESKSPSHSLKFVLIGAGIAAGLAVVLVLLNRLRKAHSPRLDYLAHAAVQAGLSPTELRDVRAIAERAALSYPVAMLLSPANMAQAVRAAGQSKSDPALTKRLQRLALRLFDEAMPVLPEDVPQAP